MDIKEILSRLKVQKYAGSGRDNRCICPCHDDKTGSLMVKELDDKVLMCCQAGCSTDAICAAIGIQPHDLYKQPLVPGMQVHTAKPSARKPSSKPVGKPQPSDEEPKEPKPKAPPLDWSKITAKYDYTDEQGVLLYQVLRFSLPDGKTFRQGVPDPSKPHGYELKTSNLRHPLYRLPEVVKAVHDGTTVYVVEGEKDADTLARLGYVATTNPGGASKPSQRIKWLAEHTEALRGADVVLVPDIDEVGMSDRRRVGLELLSVANSVRLVDLRTSPVQLPSKGDITDLVELVGDKQGKEILDMLVREARPCSEDDLQDSDTLRDKVIEVFNGYESPGYCVKDGVICRWHESDPKALCTFVAYPKYTIWLDNGIDRHGEYIIDAWDAAGKRLPTVRLPIEKFRSMLWIDEYWPMMVNVSTGNTTRDFLRQAITNVGMVMSTHITEYSHTGWRSIGGRMAYLYQGGAIGAEDVQVDIGPGLQGYRLDAAGSKVWQGITEEEAVDASVIELRQVLPKDVAIPLLAMTYLAPLRSVLERAGIPPQFLLFLVGKTGTGKSISARLALSHFASYSGDSFPATFHDSANSIREVAFALKDALLVVDDYYPATGMQDKRRLEGIAQSLSRSFGDGAGRNTLNADRTRRTSTPPRCVCVVTGEQLPMIGESGLARYYVIQMGANDVPKDERLTALQDKAQRGYLRKAMRGYIEWLLPQMGTLGDQLARDYVKLRAMAQKHCKGTHARTPTTVAHLMLGYMTMMRYVQHVTGLDEAAYMREISNAMEAIVANAARQAQEAKEDAPTRVYLDAVMDLINSGAYNVKDLEDVEHMGTPRNLIGYKDSGYYYLLPGVSYTAVCETIRKRGEEFPLSQRALNRQLKEEGLLKTEDSTGNAAKLKSIGGKPIRLLHVPALAMQGVPDAQQMVQLGMQLVEDTDNPF